MNTTTINITFNDKHSAVRLTNLKKISENYSNKDLPHEQYKLFLESDPLEGVDFSNVNTLIQKLEKIAECENSVHNSFDDGCKLFNMWLKIMEKAIEKNSYDSYQVLFDASYMIFECANRFADSLLHAAEFGDVKTFKMMFMFYMDGYDNYNGRSGDNVTFEELMEAASKNTDEGVFEFCEKIRNYFSNDNDDDFLYAISFKDYVYYNTIRQRDEMHDLDVQYLTELSNFYNFIKKEKMYKGFNIVCKFNF
jgi:hypothetical protein